jgi:hypothetical protein
VFRLQQAYSNCGAFERAQAVLHEYLALAQRAGWYWGAAAAHYWIAWSLAQPHQAAGIYYSESSHQFRMEHFERSLRIAEQHGLTDWLGRARAGTAYRLSLHGVELPRAEALLRATLAAPEGVASEDLQWTCGMLMHVCALQGSWDGVANALRQSLLFGGPGRWLIYCIGTMEEMLDRVGKHAEFVAFCEEAKVLFARAGVLLPLDQWYLRPAAPSEAFRFRLFRDDFDAPALRPEWQWHDPTRVSAYSLTEKSGHLTLHAGRGLCLRPGDNRNAPRMLLEACGDFALETKMHGDWDERYEVGSGGLLVWQDTLNFVRLEKFTMNSQHHGSIECEAWTGGQYRSLGRGLLRGSVFYLRLERTGDRFTGLCSADGSHWLTCGQAIIPMKDPLRLGVAALNGMVTHFDYVQVLGRG